MLQLDCIDCNAFGSPAGAARVWCDLREFLGDRESEVLQNCDSLGRDRKIYSTFRLREVHKKGESTGADVAFAIAQSRHKSARIVIHAMNPKGVERILSNPCQRCCLSRFKNGAIEPNFPTFKG